VPSKHDAEPVVAIGETVRFDIYRLAGDPLGREPSAVDHRGKRIDDRPHAPVARLRRPESRRLLRGYRRLLPGCSSPLPGSGRLFDLGRGGSRCGLALNHGLPIET
jgi:hypothetical protein